MQSPQPISHTPSPCRILVVDDHPLIRLGLHFTVMLTHDLRVFGEAKTAPEAAEMSYSGEYDLVILDDSLPDFGIAESIGFIRSACPDMKIVVMGDYSVDRGVAAIKLGAMGYVGKDANKRQIINVIRDVFAGKKSIDGDIVARLNLDAGIVA